MTHWLHEALVNVCAVLLAAFIFFAAGVVVEGLFTGTPASGPTVPERHISPLESDLSLALPPPA